MILSLATQGFLTHMKAEGYSPSTIALYTYVLEVLKTFLQDEDIERIKLTDLNRFFGYLREEYKPERKNKDRSPLSGGSLQNFWKGIRTFYKWAEDELGIKNRPDTKLKIPSKNPKVIMPLSEDEIRALLKVAEYAKEVFPSNRKSFKMKRRTCYRDIALILFMVDTGLRVGEISRLNLGDVKLETGEVYISPFGNSKMKTKSRFVFIGKNTRKAITRYVATRKNIDPSSPLFLTERSESRITVNSIRLLLKDLGDRANIKNVHPHRLRHTFAIQYIRNGGDVYTLKAQLGHSTFVMVETYLQLARTDSLSAHKKASPVDNIKF